MATTKTPTAPININTTLELQVNSSEQLPTWPATHAPQNVYFEFDGGNLVTDISFADGTSIRVEDTGEGPDVSGSFMKTLDWVNDFETVLAVDAWAREVHERIDDLTYQVTLEGTRTTAARETILALATDQTPQAPLPAPASDERGILAEAEVINAMARESSIRYEHDEDTVRSGTVRTGRWTADGQPTREGSIHSAHVRITLTSGTDAFLPFTVLAHMLQTHRASIRA